MLVFLAEIFHGVQMHSGSGTVDFAKKGITFYCFSFICVSLYTSLHGAIKIPSSCLNLGPVSSRLKTGFRISSPRTFHLHKALNTLTMKDGNDLHMNFRTR
jgi:Golgi nucleoside diphosphatase